MKNQSFSLVVFLGMMLAVASPADEASVKTAAMLSEFGFASDAVLTNETVLISSSVPTTVSTNGFELTLYNYSAMHGLVRSEQPDQFRIVCQLGNNLSLLLGSGFVHHGTTNRLVEMAAPLAANPMPLSISWMSNANSGGIVAGQWGGPYIGGEAPSHWTGSDEILSAYLTSGQSVKYGQCWVYAGLVTTLARTCGVPARPVTNYGSGHDRNRNKTIDIYYDYAGFRDRSRSDSTWNFHVWTECWMARGDVENANGWQVVDGTPQEISGGKFQCGPAPRSRVKNNQGGDFDVDFVLLKLLPMFESGKMMQRALHVFLRRKQIDLVTRSVQNRMEQMPGLI